MKPRMFQVLGVAGTITCLAIFALKPSFLTPDKLLVFLTFVFMTFRHAKGLLLRLSPFIGLLLIYETFRGIVPKINHRVEFEWMPTVDHWIFGNLPTHGLQDWLWRGSVSWYDIALYLFYMAHFVLPIGLVLLVWKFRSSHYWRVVGGFVAVSFAGFITFLIFPAAPPWMASENGVISPIVRISSEVWASLGINDFPSLYNSIAPNPVAAVPSLHAATATIFTLFVFRLFGRRWGALSMLYPLAIYFGTVYQGEHYAIDELLGMFYGVAGYYVASNIDQRRFNFLNRSRMVSWPTHIRKNLSQAWRVPGSE